MGEREGVTSCLLQISTTKNILSSALDKAVAGDFLAGYIRTVTETE
jgi:hypothetical protein